MVERLDEIGLDMAQFPTASHLVSWAKLSPRTIQSGPRHRGGKTGKGNPYLKGVLGEAAAAARSILVIVWHLLADPTTRFVDLGADYHDRHIHKQRRTRQLVHQLEALGHTVTLSPAA